MQPPVPAAVVRLAAGRSTRAVWENEVGGLTFEVGDEPDRCFVKWTPVDSGIDLSEEAARMSWAHAFTPVPRVLEQGHDDDGSWLVTAALAGENAVTDRWRSDPSHAVQVIGEALRAFHDALPVDACPFSWAADERVADVHRRRAGGRLELRRWHDVHQQLGLDRALALVAEPPPVDQLVVCHGDTCAPNTLLTDDGVWSGHVDLGSLGVADRWADLAIATWSTEWNYGPDREGALLDAYGVEPDPDRTRYYRLLWDLGP